MEVLSILFFLACLTLLYFKPQKETLAFTLFWIATGICFGMFFIASITCVLPNMAY